MGTERALDTGAELAASHRRGWSRYFFAGLGMLCIVVACVGFAPNIFASFTGGPLIPPIVHVHGAFMLSWVVLYTVQANLAAQGNLHRHRSSGWATVALAACVWISMGVAMVTALKRLDPDEFGFIVRPMLVGLVQLVVFPLFIVSAVLARGRAGWHKRLMTFATFVLLQAAVDRMHWLPNEGLPMFWHAGLRLYILMIPVFVFDLVTLRRIHPATLVGSAIIVAMHGIISFYWEHEGWNQFMRGFWFSLR